MYKITKEIQFDAGHRVPLHASKCKNPHGHRYRVVVHIRGDLIKSGPESGMVKDFSILKQVMMEKIHDVYDHGFIVHNQDHAMLKSLGVYYDPEFSGYTSGYDWKVVVVPFVPTAECLAKEFYQILASDKRLPNVLQVDVWETPTSCAIYTGGE